MSGVVCRRSVGGAVPPPQLNISYILTGGSLFHVAGASGSLAGIAAIGGGPTGGTPPVSSSLSVVKDGGFGSVGKGPYGDGIHETITWSGLDVGQGIAFHLEYSASDSGSPQQHDSGRYPTSEGQTIVITRDS